VNRSEYDANVGLVESSRQKRVYAFTKPVRRYPALRITLWAVGLLVAAAVVYDALT
jgi:hypothetical protein